MVHFWKGRIAQGNLQATTFKQSPRSTNLQDTQKHSFLNRYFSRRGVVRPLKVILHVSEVLLLLQCSSLICLFVACTSEFTLNFIVSTNIYLASKLVISLVHKFFSSPCFIFNMEAFRNWTSLPDHLEWILTGPRVFKLSLADHFQDRTL